MVKDENSKFKFFATGYRLKHLNFGNMFVRSYKVPEEIGNISDLFEPLNQKSQFARNGVKQTYPCIT